MPSDRPTSRPVLPAAVSTLVAGVVARPARSAAVVGVHPVALYLEVGGSVLPVVTADAVALPTALRLAVPSGSFSWDVAAGDRVLVGDGRVTLPRLDVVSARTWRPARVRRAAPSPDECASGCRGDHLRTHDHEVWAGVEPVSVGGWLADGIRQALSAVPPRGECGRGGRGDHFRTHGGEDAVAGLVGRGPGLTPSGDDALAGALLVAHALGCVDSLADAVRARLGATTAVSAALLDAAADGHAARPVVALVNAAVAREADAVRRALPAVLGIGHTSGRDTVTGIRAALTALARRREHARGRLGDDVHTRRAQTTHGRSAA